MTRISLFTIWLWMVGSGLAPRQKSIRCAMTDPTIHWPEAAREFLTCSIHFLNHQNSGYKTCGYWNNFTYGVHLALIIHFSFQSLPLYPHQKTSQASSLAWRLAVRAVGSVSLCASLWSVTRWQSVICPSALSSDLLLWFSKALRIFEKQHSGR